MPYGTFVATSAYSETVPVLSPPDWATIQSLVVPRPQMEDTPEDQDQRL